MTLDKFQQAWKAEAAQMRVSFDEALLSQKVQQSQSAFQSMILWRDVREVGMALLMIPVWFAMGRAYPVPWTWYLTVPVLVWIAGFRLIDRRRHSHATVGPNEPLLFYIKESLIQVEHQIRLLRNVFWWYLLPPSISIMTFFVHTSWNSAQSWWEALITSGLLGIFLFFVYGWIYQLNQKAVREQLQPRRDKLQKLIESLESDTNIEGSPEIMDHIPEWPSSLGNSGIASNWAAWAENWNRIIPSWREVAIIVIPTLAGAYCGWRLHTLDAELEKLAPVFFQSVVAAVIPFEITFFSLWYRSHKRHQGQPLPITGKTRPNAPAMVTIVMILVISILALIALLAFYASQRSTQESQPDVVRPPTNNMSR